MQTFGLSLTSLLLAGSALLAQPPAVPGGSPPTLPGAPGAAPTQPGVPQAQPIAPAPAQLDRTNPLDNLLIQWEQAMRQIRFLTATCTRKDTDKVAGQVKVWEGSAAYLSPNLVRLYLADQANKATFEYYLLSQNTLYEYRSQESTVLIRQLPQAPQGQVADRKELSLLFGMRALEAKRRYDFQFVKQDDHYYYLIVQPRWQEDKEEFKQARLVLYRPNFLPRQLWFETPNGSEVLWELPVLDLNTPVKPDDFQKPATPKGWKEQLVPLNNGPGAGGPPPRVARPQK